MNIKQLRLASSRKLRDIKVYPEDWKYIWGIKLGMNKESMADAVHYLIEISKCRKT
jgi:hypothetical protein